MGKVIKGNDGVEYCHNDDGLLVTKESYDENEQFLKDNPNAVKVSMQDLGSPMDQLLKDMFASAGVNVTFVDCKEEEECPKS